MVQVGRPSADHTDGDWTDQAGGTNLYAAIDESSADDATTFIQVTDDGSDHACIVEIGDLASPGSGDRTITYKALAEDGASSSDYRNRYNSLTALFSPFKVVSITNDIYVAVFFDSLTYGLYWTKWKKSGSYDLKSLGFGRRRAPVAPEVTLKDVRRGVSFALPEKLGIGKYKIFSVYLNACTIENNNIAVVTK